MNPLSASTAGRRGTAGKEKSISGPCSSGDVAGWLNFLSSDLLLPFLVFPDPQQYFPGSRGSAFPCGSRFPCFSLIVILVSALNF